MSKSTTITVALDEEAYVVFQNASEIVSKAGIRVPTGQLVQTMLNAEMSRLSVRKIAQRFLKFSSLSWSRSARSPARNSTTRKTTPFQAFPYRKPNEPLSLE
jgi:hypothetical protein